MHETGENAAQLVELLLVVYHLRARDAGDRIVFAQEDRLFGTNLLAHAAVDAADHVDVELLGSLLDLGEPGLTGDFFRFDGDRTRRADELTELTRDTTLAAVFVGHQ